MKSNINPIPRIFLDHNNLIKDETKSIMKINFQLTQYLRVKKKLIDFRMILFLCNIILVTYWTEFDQSGLITIFVT